jgi:hypothetical protein
MKNLKRFLDEIIKELDDIILEGQEIKDSVDNFIGVSDHDCHRDSYGQDACPVCDAEELVPAEESFNETDLTREEIREQNDFGYEYLIK